MDIHPIYSMWSGVSIHNSHLFSAIVCWWSHPFKVFGEGTWYFIWDVSATFQQIAWAMACTQNMLFLNSFACALNDDYWAVDKKSTKWPEKIEIFGKNLLWYHQDLFDLWIVRARSFQFVMRCFIGLLWVFSKVYSHNASAPTQWRS